MKAINNRSIVPQCTLGWSCPWKYSNPFKNERERERNVLFNNALNTFYLRLYGVRHNMVKDHSDRKETCYRHIGYSYRLTARVLLYAPSHRQDNTYHGLCYTSRGALVGTRNIKNEITYTLFHEFFSTFFFNKISLPERRNKRKSVLEITKMYYFKI